ncbi:MAG: alpha-E domain-containing protein [Siphonobacter sp.]
MLSRVANSIYWMNRYVERAENYARFVDVNFNLMLDLPPNVEEQWEPLIIATADSPVFYENYDNPSRENIIFFMTFDPQNPNSILSCLQYARENARTVRESISREMWEQLNALYWKVKVAASQSQSWEMHHFQDFYLEIRLGCQTFYGIIDCTISRTEGWHFGKLGCMLERADKTTRFLDVKYFTLLPDVDTVGSPLDLLLWSSVLKSVSAYNMYRQRFNKVLPAHIVEFLILERTFPRSVLHCLKRAESSLYEISGGNVGSTYNNDAEHTISKLRSEVEFMDIEDLFDVGLHEFLDTFQSKNNAVGSAIFETYFDLKPVV